jgi:hypothetical protein
LVSRDSGQAVTVKIARAGKRIDHQVFYRGELDRTVRIGASAGEQFLRAGPARAVTLLAGG